MKRILLLDDERSITFSLSRCLQSEEVQVLCCNDSYSAEKALLHDSVDAVIADIQLSPVNPFEALEFVHQVRTLPQRIPVIMMSCTEDMKEAVMNEGANYFFQKPLNVDELIDLLRSLGLDVARTNHAAMLPGTCEAG